jgi:hypothetical protein
MLWVHRAMKRNLQNAITATMVGEQRKVFIDINCVKIIFVSFFQRSALLQRDSEIYIRQFIHNNRFVCVITVPISLTSIYFIHSATLHGFVSWPI